MKNIKTILCYVFALFFFVAGILHFVQDTEFAAIVPPLLPFPVAIVWATGVMEVVFAIGLLFSKYRKQAGFWLAPYLLAVLPANIYMAMEGIPLGDMAASPTQRWIRVLLQFPLIALILWASGNIGVRKTP